MVITGMLKFQFKLEQDREKINTLLTENATKIPKWGDDYPHVTWHTFIPTCKIVDCKIAWILRSDVKHCSLHWDAYDEVIAFH